MGSASECERVDGGGGESIGWKPRRLQNCGPEPGEKTCWVRGSESEKAEKEEEKGHGGIIIMEKLLAHAQSMLSETEEGLARSSGRVKTEGDVKLTLFFQLFWKEKFASHSRDLHALYLLVRFADLLCGEDHGVGKWPPKAETGRRPTFWKSRR